MSLMSPIQNPETLRLRIKEKLHRRFIPIKLIERPIQREINILDDVNRNDVDFMIKMIITGNNITYQNKLYNIIEYLMKTNDIEMTNELITHFGFINLVASLDVFFNLLWHIYTTTYVKILTKSELSYISSLDISSLHSLFDNDFINNTHFAKDHASLLYSAMTGQVIQHRTIATDRYSQITHYHPGVIWRLASLHGIIYATKNLMEGYAPYSAYELVAIHTYDQLERILVDVNPENIDLLIEEYGVIIPPNTDIIENFLDQIADYKYVLNRPSDISPPPESLDNYIYDHSIAILRQYTTKELIYAYNPSSDWETRLQLIENIIEDHSTI